MTTMSRYMCVAMMAGCLLLVGQGCSKTVEGTSGSKTTEQGVASKPQAPVTLPGEERVADDIVVAKAEPSSEAAQAAAQRVREMEQEAAATASAGLQDAFFAFDRWTKIGRAHV